MFEKFKNISFVSDIQRVNDKIYVVKTNISTIEGELIDIYIEEKRDYFEISEGGELWWLFETLLDLKNKKSLKEKILNVFNLEGIDIQEDMLEIKINKAEQNIEEKIYLAILKLIKILLGLELQIYLKMS